MAQVIINTFDGGQAQDVRTFATNQQESSYNFNIYTSPHLLTPYIDMVTETVSSGTITDFAMSDVNSIIVSGTTSLVALGKESSGSSKPHFFRKNSSSDIASAWQSYAVGANNVVNNSLVVFRSYAYCLGNTTSAHNLQKFDGTSSVTTVGTLDGYGTSPAKPFVHPEDNVLYMGSGNIISSWDDTTFTATALELPDDKEIVSLTSYGAYLAIACRPKNGVGNSTCYLWGRDTTLNTLQGVLDLGTCQVNIIENLNNNLIFVTSKSVVGNYTNILSNVLTIKGYAGGSVEVIMEVPLSTSFGTGLNNLKQKVNEHLYFAFPNDTALYRFGRNKNGEYFLSHDRAYPAGTTSIIGFAIVGDFFWLGHTVGATSGRFYRTIALTESQSYATTSTYITTINPSMVVEDRTKLKQLKAVSISYTGGTSANVKVSYDGGAYLTLVSSSATGENVTEATAEHSAGTPMGEGREITFKLESTGNAKIKELRYIYEPLNTQIS